jgi:hypothetical protein
LSTFICGLVTFFFFFFFFFFFLLKISTGSRIELY